MDLGADADMLERLREVVPMGGAICLVGAGFSVAATDQSGTAIPSTQQLILEIKEGIGIDHSEDASLADIADFCDEDAARHQILQRILISRLTLCNPSSAQRVVATQPWRSVFTTNFDDTLERCMPDGKYQVISPTSGSTGRVVDKLPIYYMHGRAKDLIESSKNPNIVISERNYLNLKDENHDLYAQLKNELFCANLIVIVGYSMRDLDVARILLGSSGAFHRKTVIICDQNENRLSISRLGKFGHVLPIGVVRLAEELKSARRADHGNGPAYQFVENVPEIDSASEIEGDDFVKLILTGNFSRTKYRAQMQQDKGVSELYCVRRGGALDVVVSRPQNSTNRFVVTSDIGNGKSIFLDQLSDELITSGYRVIRISSRLEEVFSELDSALQTQERTAFLIDDVIRYRNVAKFIGARLNAYCILVCCTRADVDDVQFKELDSILGGSVRQIDLNRLSKDELESWDRVLERWGLWEQRISLPKSERLDFLSRQCGAENRSIVLSLFRNSQIAFKIDQIVNFFLRNGDQEKALSALLISSLCQQHVAWESLVSWLNIDEGRLRNNIRNSPIANLLSSGRDWNIFTSAQLAEYILRTKYVNEDRDTLVDVFCNIVLNTAASAADAHLGANFRENLKELMKFRFLTRLFGDGVEALKLINIVYSRLSKAPYIRKNPQFWLQYAMSRMEVDDLDNAETYLNTALGLAKERGMDYSPFQVIDQRARLYFRKNCRVQGVFKVSEIKIALKDLGDLLGESNREIVYIFRSVPFILAFVETQIDDFDKELRDSIMALALKIHGAGDGYSVLPRSQKGETQVLRKAMSDLLLTLRNA